MNAFAPDMAISSQEEADLWIVFAKDRSARDRERLFSAYQPYARRIAKRHLLDRMSGDIEYGDLCQLAATGLLEAIDRYEPDRGVPFSIFATRRVSGSIVDGIAKMSERREQQSFRNRIRTERARAMVRDDADVVPTDQALQALIDVAIALALGFMLEDAGLYMTPNQPDRRPSAYDSIVWNETVRKLSREVSGLPLAEAEVIRRHYLEGMDFATIASLLSLGKSRVSQLHKAGLERLRKRLAWADNIQLDR